MSSRSWIRAIFTKVFSRNTKPEKKKTARFQLLPLEDRIVPAVPFSPAFPYAVSINLAGSSSFTGDVKFNGGANVAINDINSNLNITNGSSATGNLAIKIGRAHV